MRGQFAFLLFDARIAALEIETGSNFFSGLIDRILYFNDIGF